MTKTRKVGSILLSLLVFAVLLCGFSVIGGATESSTDDPSETNVAYIILEKEQKLLITPTGYTVGNGSKVAHTGAYVISGASNAEIYFEGKGSTQTAQYEYNVIFHNFSAISEKWRSSLTVHLGVTLNMTVIGINEFAGHNHAGIRAGNGNEALERIVNLTVAENSSVKFYDKYTRERGMADGITLNILSGECSVDMTAENWYNSDFSVSNGTAAKHTGLSYAPTADICKISCSDSACGTVLFDAPHKYNTDVYVDETSHADVCRLCKYTTNTEAHTFENVLLSETSCVPKCTDCNYVNTDAEQEHSIVDGVCEHCSTAQTVKVQNGDETKIFIIWNAAIAYINENDNTAITLLSDASAADNPKIEKNLKIDLAGHKLSSCNTEITGEIEVEITDSSENKAGEVIAINDSSYAFSAYNNSALIIDGIKLDGGLKVNSGASITVKSMTAISETTTFYIYETGTITINGGDFEELCLSLGPNYRDTALFSVKNITCKKYVVDSWNSKKIHETLADGYTLVYADGSYVNVTKESAQGEIKTVAHTHNYSVINYDLTNHWSACLCFAIDPDNAAEAHSGGTATCTKKAICEKCKHEYGYTIAHEGGTATCTEKAVCEECGNSYGERIAHTGGTPTCTQRAVCEECGNSYGSKLAHTGGTPTCTEKAVCEECENEYGYTVPHSWDENNICTSCGKSPLIELTVDDTKETYTSISEVFGVLYENGVENARIKLLGNVAFEEESVYAQEGKIVLDLNGYTLSGCYIRVDSADITVTDTSEQKSGVLESDFELGGACKLTVESGYIDGMLYLVSQHSLPTVVINGGHFSENFVIFSLGGNITIRGGEFEYAIFAIFEYSGLGTDLAIIGGTFVNGITVDSEEPKITLDDILPVTSCMKYLDADGNELTIDRSDTYHEGYVRVVHDGEFEIKIKGSYHWKECADCGAVTHYDIHYGGAATCTEKATCELCGEKYGNLDSHRGGEITCAEKAVCSVCGQKYGITFPHSYEGGDVCVNCDAPLPIKLIAGDEEFIFENMSDALQKAVEYDSASIVLQTNIINTDPIYAEIFGSIKLDLAGYTVHNVIFNVYGDLTVDDSSESGEGAIYAIDNLFVDAGGSLTVNGGNINVTIELDGSENNNAVATINGGKFTGYHAVYTESYSELYINGGIFDCFGYEIYCGYTDITAVISGGVFPNGLEIDSSVNVYSVISTLECIVCVDENGDVIPRDDLDTEHYEGYIAVIHGKEYLDVVDEGEWHRFICTNCDYISEPQEHAGEKATCDTSEICTECGATVEDALGHLWNNGEITEHPTCTAKGVKTYTCTRDGDHTKTEDVAIDPDAHSWNDGEITTQPTCTAKGVKTYTCTHNGTHTRTEDVVIDENAHSWNAGEITTQPTCTAKGVKTYTCTRDGSHTKTEDVAIDENAHSWNDGEITTQPTCTEAGVKTYTCTHNGEHTRTEDVAIDPDAHTFGEWTVTKEATETEKGNRTKTCACGHTVTEDIPALGGGTETPDNPSGDDPSGDAPSGDGNTGAGENGNGTPTVDPEESDDGLSGGAIAGISIGSAAVVGLSGFSLFWFVIKKKTLSDLVGIFKK